jgi:hypothetical protein
VAKYTVTQSPVSHLLALVESEQIAIPELQRPFVWDSIKVRDLMDSLYNGYPVGYLITWQSVGAALKGGLVAAHQQITVPNCSSSHGPGRRCLAGSVAVPACPLQGRIPHARPTRRHGSGSRSSRSACASRA